jgi:hypothetical protein
MSHTYHGAAGLVKLAGTTISTFPDRTRRIDLKYACRKSYLDTALSSLQLGSQIEGHPGYFVSQFPQTTIREDGFAEIQVSGWNVSQNQTLPASETSRDLQIRDVTLMLPNDLGGVLSTPTAILTFQTQQIGVRAFYNPNTSDVMIDALGDTYNVQLTISGNWNFSGMLAGTNLYARAYPSGATKWRLIAQSERPAAGGLYWERNSTYVSAPDRLLITILDYSFIYKFDPSGTQIFPGVGYSLVT